MSNPIQTERIVEAMARASEPSDWRIIDIHIHPGAVDPDSRAIDMRDKSLARAQAALSTAYPMIREEMARIAEAWGGPPCTGQSWVAISKKGIAAAIRTTDLPLADKERE